MAASKTEGLTHHLRRIMLRADGAGMPDGQLLEAFISHRDAAAFEALVRRHGPMVLGVCRRILRDPHDAEDAFQATFLVLARKAASVSPRERVGNFLYGVAHTTAIRARAANSKRRSRERLMRNLPEPEAVPTHLRDDLQQFLDDELARLPDKYRVPIVLCDLEGRTRRDVARQLRIPEGTLSSRLTTARRLLAKRLARYGLAVSGGALAAVLSPSVTSAGVSASLAKVTAEAAMLIAAGQTATGLISVPVAALTEGVVKAMLLTKLKSITAVMLVVASLCGAAGLIYPMQAAEQTRTPRATENADKETQPAVKRQRKLRPDKEQLQGTWKIVSTVDDGKEDESEVGEKWTFKDRTIKAKFPATKNSEFTFYYRFRLDDTTNPKQFHFVEGNADDLFDIAAFDKRLDDVDKRNEGIYSITGDTLKICISRTKGERPTAFESKEGSDYILCTFQRHNPTDEKKDNKKQRHEGSGEVKRPRADLEKGAARPFRLAARHPTFRLNVREWTIPVRTSPDAKLKRIHLNVSTDAGKTWRRVDSIPANARAFHFKAPKDGTYWFAVQTESLEGELRPVAPLCPDLKILVDTTNEPAKKEGQDKNNKP